jgi:hypothetical protein
MTSSMLGTEGRSMVGATIRHAAPAVVEGTVIPLLVFTVVVHSADVHAALWASLGWSGLAFGRRALLGGRVSGILVLTAMGTLARLATVAWTGSAHLYFLQPVLATLATAAAFGVSAVLRRPLAARLGADLVPLDPESWKAGEVRRVCNRISLVWAVALIGNACLTLWLLYGLPVSTFVLVRPFVGVFTTLPAIVVSFVLGLGAVRRSKGAIRMTSRTLMGTEVVSAQRSGAPLVPAPRRSAGAPAVLMAPALLTH